MMQQFKLNDYVTIPNGDVGKVNEVSIDPENSTKIVYNAKSCTNDQEYTNLSENDLQEIDPYVAIMFIECYAYLDMFEIAPTKETSNIVSDIMSTLYDAYNQENPDLETTMNNITDTYKNTFEGNVIDGLICCIANRLMAETYEVQLENS